MCYAVNITTSTLNGQLCQYWSPDIVLFLLTDGLANDVTRTTFDAIHFDGPHVSGVQR